MSNPVTLLRNCPLVNSKAERVAAAEVFDDCRAVVLYLTASWCPPCRKFSPQLAAAVRGTSVKVVMLSADRSEDEFKAYLAHTSTCKMSNPATLLRNCPLANSNAERVDAAEDRPRS
ncbi:putative nucleoredoxin 1-2 [Diplonema papillatum]|nr:putative nucleoredoxin 1-2 [Diplonema papillatum]